MTKKRKEIALALLILVALAISLALIIVPDKLDYGYSLKYLKDKEYELGNLASNITQNKSRIKEEMITYKSLEKEIEDADTLRALIMEDKYFIDLDIPSMLIFLEQEALASDVELSIEFGKIIHHEKTQEDYDMLEMESDMGYMEDDMDYMEDEMDYMEDEDYGIDDRPEVVEKDEVREDVNDDLTSSLNISQKEVSVVSGDEINLSDSVIYEEIPNIKGLKVTTVPIKVKGSYENIGDFIKRLDVVDYLEPGYMGMYSNEGEVSSVITLFIFHKDGGGI